MGKLKINKTKVAKSVIISGIAVHIYGVHAKLLYAINPDKSIDAANAIYSFVPTNEATITTQIFALVFAVTTAGILFLYNEHRWQLPAVLLFAILDGFGMFIYYNINMDGLFVWFSSAYYAIYAASIIISVGLHKDKKEVPDGMDESILAMSRSGIEEPEISDILKIAPRIVKKVLSNK